MQRSTKRSRGQQGAALVEAAFVLPVILTLVLGGLEFGMLFMTQATAQNLARVSVRTASAVGNTGGGIPADKAVLTAFRKTANNLAGGDTIERVVIYRSTTINGAPTTDCKNGIATDLSSSPDACNVFTGDEALNTDLTRFTSCRNPQSIEHYPACERVNSAEDADVIGVWIQVRHKSITGLFADDKLISSYVTMRLEPRS